MSSKSHRDVGYISNSIYVKNGMHPEPRHAGYGLRTDSGGRFVVSTIIGRLRSGNNKLPLPQSGRTRDTAALHQTANSSPTGLRLYVWSWRKLYGITNERYVMKPSELLHIPFGEIIDCQATTSASKFSRAISLSRVVRHITIANHRNATTAFRIYGCLQRLKPLDTWRQIRYQDACCGCRVQRLPEEVFDISSSV